MDIQNRDDKEDKTEYTHSPTYAVLAVRKSCDPRNWIYTNIKGSPFEFQAVLEWDWLQHTHPAAC